MRILFCQGGERWKIDDCGKAYTSGSFDERIWERYKLYGSELTVMFAEERKRYNSGLLPTKYNFFDETKYNRISLVDEINPKVNTFNILIKKRNRDIIYKAVKDADVIIIRSLGTFVTNSTFKIANKLNKPIITEVTGPIFEGNYYGGFFSRMLAVSREWSAKKLNSVAKYTLYVTKNALQERYPNAGIMVGISDVYLPEVDIKKIVEKRSRKNNAEKVVFGTAGSTSLPRKGHKYVIKALGILKREGITNIEYHMAGGGDEADIIKQAKKENVLEMIHFDGTIPASTDTVKAKRGRPKKKPDYDREKEIEALQQKVIDLFGEPFDDRVERSEAAPSIREIAKALDTTPLTVRKMLITAGYYSTKHSREVQELYEQGCTIQEIMDQTGLKRASVHGYGHKLDFSLHD